ncbi:Uncharacterised protein [Shigella flexneri]|nr:Uncharacterised protein [Shigella flexneri]
MHIGNDNKQQIVAFAHGFRDGLDATLLRFFLQALTDFRRVGEGTRHCQCLVGQPVSRHITDLREVNQMHHQ